MFIFITILPNLWFERWKTNQWQISAPPAHMSAFWWISVHQWWNWIKSLHPTQNHKCLTRSPHHPKLSDKMSHNSKHRLNKNGCQRIRKVPHLIRITVDPLCFSIDKNSWCFFHLVFDTQIQDDDEVIWEKYCLIPMPWRWFAITTEFTMSAGKININIGVV